MSERPFQSIKPRDLCGAAVAALIATQIAASPAEAAVGFDSAYVGESAFLDLTAGQVGTLTVFFRNEGAVPWVRGSSSQVDLAACLDDQVTCLAQDSAEAAFNDGSWVSPVAYATQSQDVVRPGGLGTFSYRIRVPDAADQRTHLFNGELVIAAARELVHPEGYYHAVTVTAPPAMGAVVRASFEGVPSAGPSEQWHPDHGLAVGPSSLLMVSNHIVALRDRSGGPIASMRDWQFFGPVVPAGVDTGGDPWMTFDPFSGRFFYVMDGSAGNGHTTRCEPGACGAYHLLAVSRTADPRSLASTDWYFYALDRTLLRLPNGPVQTAYWGDFDNIVVDQDSVLITWPAYAFAAASRGVDHSQGPKVRILDKATLVRGDPITDWVDLEFVDPRTGEKASFEKVEPAIGSGGSVPFFFVGLRGCEITVWGLESPSVAPSLRGQTVPGRSCEGPYGFGAAQPGGAPPIFILPSPHNVVYRDGSLWSAHLIRRDVAGRAFSAVRWFEMDVSEWPARPRLIQDATLLEDSVWHLAPALMIDAHGSAVIVFGRSGEREFPSLYYTYRSASDAPDHLRPAVRLKAGERPWSTSDALLGGRNGWVDFFVGMRDPVDGSVWVFGAYVTAEGERGTWVANVVVAVP